MAFIPNHQSKSPKYDVYGCRDGENIPVLFGDVSSDDQSNIRGLLEGVQYRAKSTKQGNVPSHSTPVNPFAPPPVHVSTDKTMSESLRLTSGDQLGSTSSENKITPLESPLKVNSGSEQRRKNVDSGSGSTKESSRTLGPIGSNKTLSSGSRKTPGMGSSRVLGSGRTITPGSSHSRTPASGCWRTPGEPPASTIVAVVEGRGQARGEVGVAAIDLRCPQLSLAQFSDTHTYTRTLTKLTILNPLEVVVASTAVPTDFSGRAGGGGVVRVIQESISRTSVTAVHRRYFNDTRGLAIVRHLASRECAYIERHISSKYYCLAAVAALMKYVEHIQHVTYAPHSLHVTLSSSENTMCIEHSSCRKLELVRSLRGGWENSLFGALRHTRTLGGTRLLRASLLQPHADTATITARLDALQYFIENPDLFYTLQSILGRFPDIDWLLSMCVQLPKEDTEQRCELRLNYVIALKNTLELLEPMKMALEEVTNPLLASVKEAVCSETLNELLTLLREVLHDDARLVKGAAAMKTQRCYAIKSHVNGLLDVARKIYSEIIDDITERNTHSSSPPLGCIITAADKQSLRWDTQLHHSRCVIRRTLPELGWRVSGSNSLPPVGRKCVPVTLQVLDSSHATTNFGFASHVEELGKEFKLMLQVGHNAARGFHISIPKKRNTTLNLPPVLIQVQQGRGCITCTTEQLYQLDQRSRDTLREILIMSNVIVLEMLVEARGRVSALHALGEAVATVDLIVALAQSAAVGSWVRPEFSQALAIQRGRHPILDVLTSVPPIPNNTFLSPESCVMVVTGPNMSGKSTYLRQIALIQILAQIGSFVPAEYASVRIVRQLFTHLGSEDSPENNASTFQVQMSDVAHMLDGATMDSLVLLDELGSGTSLEEGGGIAWAVMELLIHARVPTILATHAFFLTKLADIYPSVTNYHLESEDASGGRLQFTHIVRPGITQATHYGLALAQVTSIPPSVVSRAQDLALTLMPSVQITSYYDSECSKFRAVYHLAHQLIALAEATNMPSLPSTCKDGESEVCVLPYARNKKNQVMCEGGMNSIHSTPENSHINDELFDSSRDESIDACSKDIRSKLQILLEKFMDQVPQKV